MPDSCFFVCYVYFVDLQEFQDMLLCIFTVPAHGVQFFRKPISCFFFHFSFIFLQIIDNSLHFQYNYKKTGDYF